MAVRQWLGRSHVEDRVQPPADQVRGQRLGVHQRAARGVDEQGAGAHQADPAGVDDAAGLRGVGGVDGHHVAGRHQGVEVGRGDAEQFRLGRTDIGVVEQHLHVEDPQEFDDPPADPGGPDDADGQPVRAEPVLAVEVGAGAVGAPGAEEPGQREDPLGAHDDRRQGVLGDGYGVGGGGRRDDDPAIERNRGQKRFHRAGRMDHGPQRGRPVQQRGIDGRAAPAGEQDLGATKCRRGLRGVELADHGRI